MKAYSLKPINNKIKLTYEQGQELKHFCNNTNGLMYEFTKDKYWIVIDIHEKNGDLITAFLTQILQFTNYKITTRKKESGAKKEMNLLRFQEENKTSVNQLSLINLESRIKHISLKYDVELDINDY